MLREASAPPIIGPITPFEIQNINTCNAKFIMVHANFIILMKTFIILNTN